MQLFAKPKLSFRFGTKTVRLLSQSHSPPFSQSLRLLVSPSPFPRFSDLQMNQSHGRCQGNLTIRSERMPASVSINR